MLEAVKTFFGVSKSGSTVKAEVLSGVVLYFAVVYVLFLVPSTIMNVFPEAFNEKGQLIQNYVLSCGITAGEMLVSLTMASCIAAAAGTLIMALGANMPIIQGPSLSIATFVTYTVCIKMGLSYNAALAAVFIEGVVFFLFATFGVTDIIQKSIPVNIKYAATGGIGLFIAFTGLQKAHMLETNSGHLIQLVDLTNIHNYNTKSSLLCIFCVILIAVLIAKKVHFGILIGEIVCIILAIPLGLLNTSGTGFSTFGHSMAPTAFKLDFIGLFSHDNGMGAFGVTIYLLVIVASICIMDIFETMGTVIATDYIITNNRNESAVKRLSRIFKSDAAATICGSVLGATSVSSYVESTIMSIAGGRTGLATLVTGILFLVTVFISPLAVLIPEAAIATVLIIAGFSMLNSIRYINFNEIEDAIPACFTLVMTPLTYSLVVGIALGFISHVVIKITVGRGKELKRGTVVLAVIFILYFFFVQ